MKKSSLLFSVFLILLIFVFPILHFFYLFDSLAGPLFCSIFLLFVFYFFTFKSFPIKSLGKKIVVIFAFFFVHSLTCYLLNQINLFHLISSFIVLCFVLYSSFLCYKLLTNYDNSKFHHFINVIYYIFILIFIFSIFSPFKLSQIHLKPIFPYNEPSHFCLFFGPFMYYKLVISKGSGKIFFAILSLIIGLISQNLIIILSTFIVLSFIYRKKIFFLILIGFVGLFMLQKNEYFSRRLNISQETDNISVLAFIQGWEFAYKHSIKSNFLGIGFQQLGYVPAEIDTSIQIEDLIGSKLNDKDGSFNASKLISEFGIFGLVILLFYFKILFDSLKILTKEKIVNLNNSVIVFCCCSIFSFFVEIFIRGLGYFSPTFFIFTVSVIYLLNRSKTIYFFENKQHY